MTHHYTIEVIKKNLFFKATYRNGKFRKIEHLRGKIDREFMNFLGRIIPVNEEEISTLNEAWFNRVNYTIDVKQEKKTLNKRFVDAWFNFYEETTTMKPKYTGADGKALAQIMTYLKSMSANEEGAFITWQLILDSWEDLNEFHQSQLDLKYINSKLNVIIREIRTKKDSNIKGTNRSVEL